MVQFEKIKLIIWDMDETFWSGTLSEESVCLSDENKSLIANLTDIGIVNSICSKNYENQVVDELNKYNLTDYFVFKSVNWEPKGSRVKQLIENMQLRAANVLFIDDNPSNLEEVKYFCPEIMLAGPEIISDLIKWTNNQEKKDIAHKRLKQYKVLEEKNVQKKNFASNEDFLFSSNIKLEIKYDCINVAKRIQELVMRSNQLNFTKKRDSLDEIVSLLNDDSYNNGYVTVKDNFGDYGLVGFFSVKDNECVHFLFSCRTLGMGIEQYVYNFLGRPKLKIEGEVISDLSSEKLPEWINQNAKGQDIDSFEIENAQKQTIVDELPFMDIGAYCDNIYKYPYKVVVLSLLQDCNFGVYQRKQTGERFAFIEYTSNMTDPKNYDKLINKKCNVGGFDFTESFLKEFSEKYEFLGRNTPETILENVKYIREHMQSDCVLALMLGTETFYDMGDNPAYKDRHIVHKQMNDLIREWAKTQSLVELVDVNKYITGPESYYDHINHFVKPVYYNMAKDIVEIINKYTDSNVSETSKAKIAYMKLHDYVGDLLAKIKNKR